MRRILTRSPLPKGAAAQDNAPNRRAAEVYATMKVVQVLPALEGGGVEQGTLEIADALVRAGHESVVVSSGGRMVDALERGGSRHVHWRIGVKRPEVLLEVRRFRRWLATERPHIVHARSRMPAWVCWLAWRRMAATRPRFVTTVHGLYSVGAYSAVMTRGERTIAVSDTARRYVERYYPRTPPQALRTIHRGVDAERYHRGFEPESDWRERWRGEFPQLVGKRLVLLPGRVTRLKGHRDFIAVLERLRPEFPDVAGLVVGGTDPKHRRYERELRTLAPWLVFVGHRTDLREIMAVATAVTSFSTQPESFGRTVLEALSLGTPVVGYDHGGVGEILAKTFPPGRARPSDVEDTTAKLRCVLADEGAARRAIRKHDFDVNRMCAQTLALYCELAEAA